jgi:hypothetical protein
VVAFFLEKGVEPAVTDRSDMTGLHRAAASRHTQVVRVLLEHGAPLEVKNQWGGTVLDSTVYFARHDPAGSAEYVGVLEALLAAGADVGAVTPFPTGSASLDELLRRHGARS